MKSSTYEPGLSYFTLDLFPKSPSSCPLGLESVGIRTECFYFYQLFYNFAVSVKRFAFLWQTEGEEDDSYDDPMNVVPKTPQS